MSISLVKEPTSSGFELAKKPNPKRPGRSIGIKEPSGGLVPIWDTGLWVTPDEPADPRDCERYPTSAFCDPYFFTLTPTSFEPSIAIDRCNIGVRLDYSFGFIRLPPISLVYRDPSDDCKIQLEQPPADYSNGGVTPFPNNLCDENTRSLTVYWVSSFRETEDYVPKPTASGTVSGDIASYESEVTISVDLIEYPYTGTETPILNSRNIAWNNETDKVKGRIHFTAKQKYKMNEVYYDRLGFEDIPLEGEVVTGGIQYIDDLTESVNILGTGVGTFNNMLFALQDGVREARTYLEEHPVTRGKLTFTSIPMYALYNQDIGVFDDDEIESRNRTHIANWDIKVVCGGEDYRRNPPPPSEDNPPPRHCCMSCCPSQGEQDNSLLALILQKVEKLSSIVGVDEYPISVPASLISKDEGFLGNLIPNQNVEVPNLSIFLAWYIERFDEILGQWEIPIEIKDSDPTKSGEQPVGIKLPNVAECLAEMFTLCFQTNINSETLLNIATRGLVETGTDKQQNFITYKLLQSLTDYIGYKQKDVVEKMPLLFTLNKTRYDEILQESEVEVSVPEFDDKFGLEADLMRFREAVSILQAQHKVKVNPNGDIKAQILKYLLDTVTNVDKVTGEDTEQDFEDFIEQVETGFINTRGVTNNTNPYGKPFNERPRIRDLTNFETDNPES